jgi:UDP-glucose 4-epimerase
MTRYLVTGGCGFIGSHLVDALCAAGHAVRVVDDLSAGRRELLPPDVEFVHADLGVVDPAPLVADVDGVFHLAAVASVLRSTEAWVETHRSNLTATVRLFDALRRRPATPVVYASSAAVYGDRHGAITESAPLAPLSSYGADKAACELHARAGTRVHGLASTGLRFFNVYGPRQRVDDAYAGVITLFAERIRCGERLRIYGDGTQCRDFVFVADVVRVLTAAMERLRTAPSPVATVANVGSGRATTINALADTLMRILDRRVGVEHVAPRAGDIRSSLADTRRMHTLFGIEAPTSLDTGLQRWLAAAARRASDPGHSR